MGLQPSLALAVIDGLTLDDERRAALRPGEMMPDPEGHERRLPRFFYRVDSWDQALETQLTPHFGLWELIDVDFREAVAARTYPRYVPCAITLLAAHLEIFRVHVGAPVRVAANGGYRSPGHAHSTTPSPHSWGVAADIYRIGGDLMDSKERIERYIETARTVLPGIWTRPFGEGPGFAFDHVHIDLGFVEVQPHETAADADTQS